jgi:hypothetical protein
VWCNGRIHCCQWRNLYTGQDSGDFLPRLAPLALFADEIHKRFKAAAEWSSAAGTISFHRLIDVDGF